MVKLLFVFVLVLSAAVVCAVPGCTRRGGSAQVVDQANAASTYQSVYEALSPALLAAVGEVEVASRRAGGSSPPGRPIADLLEEQAAEIERLVLATGVAASDFGTDYTRGADTLLPHLVMARGLARVLVADAERLLERGDRDGAARRVAAIGRMAVHVARPARWSIEWKVACALAALAANFVDDNPSLASAAWKTDAQQAFAAIDETFSRASGDAVGDAGPIMTETLAAVRRAGTALGR